MGYVSMARRIRNQNVTSSVARLLSPIVATAAMAPIDRGACTGQDDGPNHVVPTARTKHIKREFILSRETDSTVNDLIAVFNQQHDIRLTASQLIRAVLIVLRSALPAIRMTAERAGPFTCPGNSGHQLRARIAFERRLATVIEQGLRIAAARQAGADEPL